MKPLIIAALLLAAISPANATPWRDIHAYQKSSDHCIYARSDDEDRSSEEIVKACAEADRLEKKLEARGYCAYANSGIGRAGKPWTQKEWTRTGGQGAVSPKGRKHCYIIHDPSIPSYFHDG